MIIFILSLGLIAGYYAVSLNEKPKRVALLLLCTSLFSLSFYMLASLRHANKAAKWTAEQKALRETDSAILDILKNRKADKVVEELKEVFQIEDVFQRSEVVKELVVSTQQQVDEGK